MIIIVTEQMLGGKPILKRLRRKARFACCQMVRRPGERPTDAASILPESLLSAWRSGYAADRVQRVRPGLPQVPSSIDVDLLKLE